MVAFSFHRFPYLFELKTSVKVRIVLDKLIPFADCERLSFFPKYYADQCKRSSKHFSAQSQQ